MPPRARRPPLSGSPTLLPCGKPGTARPYAGRATTPGMAFLGVILVVALVLLLLGAIPTWPYSREWGYRPTGILGFLLVLFLILLLLHVV